MFQKPEENIWRWRWPIITITVLVVLLGLQILRVNRRSPEAPFSADTRVYTTLGPLVSGDLIIPAENYHSTRIDLNRRAKISGEFRTGNIRSRVSVLVLKETDFDSWKQDLNYDPIAKTGYVPGGKISLVV
jgi:hypothetical protein